MVDEKSIMLHAVIIGSSGVSFMVNPIRYWSFIQMDELYDRIYISRVTSEVNGSVTFFCVKIEF